MHFNVACKPPASFREETQSIKKQHKKHIFES